MKRVVRVPRDAAALSLGADETAAALVAGAQAAGHEIELVRTGSRGICWLEPLVEVETGAGSVAYGRVDAQDVPALLAAGMLDGGSHPLRRGPVAAISWFASQQRVTFERVGERAGTFLSIAECRWEMVVTRIEGRRSLTVRGPETRATPAELPADGEWLAIRFRLGTYLPELLPAQLSEGRAVTLPAASSRAFWLRGSAWEYPDFENAETFVERLRRSGAIEVDAVVTAVLRGAGAGVEPRTVERHFRRATGVSRSAIRQIERARFATQRVREGVDFAEAAFEAGYFDQAHLTRSLRRFVGQTPGELRRGDRQLSFLYKTEAGAAG